MQNSNEKIDKPEIEPGETNSNNSPLTDGHTDEATLSYGQTSFYTEQEKDLKAVARKIFITLGVFIVISGILLGFRNELKITLIWACIIAGVLGSTSSALISALDRKAKGWEFDDGKKYPKDGKKSVDDDKRDMFSQRMATFFSYRPLFGIIGGLLVFFGIQAKYFGDTSTEEEAKVIFLSLLSGLFIKSLIEKLKKLFDNIFFGGK